MTFKKYLEIAQDNSKKAFELEQYAKQILTEFTMKYRSTSESIRLDRGIRNTLERQAEAKQLLSLAYMQKVAAIKNEWGEALNEVILALDDAKNAIPKATPEQLAEYKDMVNDLKTDLLLTIKFEDKQRKIENFMKEIDSIYLAAELRREFGNISKDSFNGMEGDHQAEVTVLFKQYYERLKDGTEFYPEDVREIIGLANNAMASLTNNQIYSRTYIENYAGHLLEPEQIKYIENPDDYLLKNVPELMEVNIEKEVDQIITEKLLQPDTEQSRTEALLHRFKR